MLRRLTRAQFANAMQDLLAVDVDETQLDPDSWDGNFAVIGASTVVTSPNGVEQYHSTVEGALATVFADSTKRSKLLGCTLGATPSTDTCLRGFLGSFGKRAWRRPLEATELDRLISVAQTASTALASTTEGAHWATVALLSSPNFLYRPELGAKAADGALHFQRTKRRPHLRLGHVDQRQGSLVLVAARAGARVIGSDQHAAGHHQVIGAA